jgi:hypothetical protein
MLLFSILAPPFPDGAIDQGDRQHTAHTYSGILATPVVVVVEGTPIYLYGSMDSYKHLLGSTKAAMRMSGAIQASRRLQGSL